ncbi:hypothetical protein MIND_01318300 [Mycena indigotica]|uniref:DUF6534 domain-containing protein n=1 Tax=Mycena indigotica TaxID=2126181 RepID=A0A8H6VR78_9AGAR|nr:uncharacterized protein MIND_01318300 [Mycena indigotica]KAF7290774.1 hypothetical protein MIND_01318300 [Mycena indigotica]
MVMVKKKQRRRRKLEPNIRLSLSSNRFWCFFTPSHHHSARWRCRPDMATALPNVQLSYGPMLLGVFVNMILYGVFITQVFTYYKLDHKDGAWMRCFILYLLVLETLNTAFDMAMMYQPLILEYGHGTKYFPTMFPTEPLMIVLISTPIQIFFGWRIRTITHLSSIPLLISLFALASLAGGLWTTARIAILQEFSKKPLLHAPALLWFLASAVSDVLITISLVLTLSHRKTGFAATDTVIDKIIRTTIQTNLITAIFGILDVIFFMVFPHYALNFIWDLALSKLYSNALLSTLNARLKLGAISTATSRPTPPTDLTSNALVFEDMAELGEATTTSKFESDELHTEVKDESIAEIVETPRQLPI